MREILFRGKRTDNWGWIEGGYVKYNRKHYIISVTNGFVVDWIEVDPETVGQYTGLNDRNGKRIFEGDVVTFKATVGEFKPCVVEYSNADARFVAIREDRCYAMAEEFTYEVIGNILDNPDLIGGMEDGT